MKGKVHIKVIVCGTSSHADSPTDKIRKIYSKSYTKPINFNLEVKCQVHSGQIYCNMMIHSLSDLENIC